MACFYRFFKRLLVLILLVQLTLQSVLILEPSQAQAAAPTRATKESPSQGDFFVAQTPLIFSYSSLMRQVGEIKEKDAALSQSERAQVIQELKSFLQSEKSHVKDLRLPYSRRRAYISLLEKQLDSLDTTPPGKIESIINTISSWFSQEELASAEDSVRVPDKPAEFAFAPDDIRLTAATLGQVPVQRPETPLSWWQRLWQKIKDLFGIASAQAEDSNYLPTVADINPDNQEIIINSDINDLAASLSYNPVKIFNYVRASVIYEPYYGAKKGSVGCLKEKVCNDIDTASLTIALLRASGIPARYHKALAVVPVGALKEMLGVDEVKTVYFALATNKIPVSLVGGNNPSVGGPLDAANLEEETQLALEWTVPELFYEYDERGANIDNTVNLETLVTASTTPALQSYLASYPKKQWIPAEVLIKNPLTHTKKEIVADTASFDSQAFWYGWLQYQGALSPMQKYQDDLLSATSKDVFTVAYQSTEIRPGIPTADILPPGLPYQFTVGTDNTGASVTDERWSGLPDGRREQLIITLKKSSDESTVLSHVFFASEINNIPISLIYDGATQTDKDAIASYGGLAYTPASLVAIAPSFNLEGANYTTANTLSIGDSLILDFQYQVKGQTLSQNQKFSISGNEEGIFIMMSRVRPDIMLDDSTLDAATRASRILITGNAALAREYLKHYQEQNDLLKKSLDYEYQVQFSRAVVTQNRILTPVGGIPTTFDFQGLSIDASSYISDYSNRANYKTHRQPFRLLSSLEASYYESGLFKDIAGLDAVSTATGLQYAYANPGTYNVQIITSTNESVIDSLNLTTNTKANMHADVAAGKTIITPDKFITKGTWSGILYISLAPDWTGRYAIGEQVQNGGWTLSQVNPDSWTSSEGKPQYAYQYINGPKMFIFKDNPDKMVACSITVTNYNAIVSGVIAPGWTMANYGKPCMYDGPYAFGTHDHLFILATDGGYFKSQSDSYDYWRTNNFVRSKIAEKSVSANVTTRSIFPYWGTYAYEDRANKKLTVYNPQQLMAHNVVGNMYKKYMDGDKIIDEYVPDLLGYPTNEVADAAMYTLFFSTGYYQQFTNGTLYQVIEHVLPDPVFVVFGKINEEHNQLGGTSGIGFPETDPQWSSLGAGIVFQNFESGKKLHHNIGTDQVTVDTVVYTLPFDKPLINRDEFIEGLVDGFYEVDLYGLAKNVTSGVLASELIKLAGKLAYSLGKKEALKFGGAIVSGLGIVLVGGSAILISYQNAPLYNACTADDEAIIEEKTPSYYCGKLGAAAVAQAVGFTTDMLLTNKLNKFGVGGEVARAGKNRLVALTEKGEWATLKRETIFSLPGIRTKFYERVEKLNLDDNQIRTILEEPRAIKLLTSKGYYTWLNEIEKIDKEVSQLSPTLRNAFKPGNDLQMIKGEFHTATGLFEGYGLHSADTLEIAMDNGVIEVFNSAGTAKYARYDDIPFPNGVRNVKIRQRLRGELMEKTMFPKIWDTNDKVNAVYEAATGGAPGSEFSKIITKKGFTIKVTGKKDANGLILDGYPDASFSP